MKPSTISAEQDFDTLYSQHWQRLVGLAECLGCPDADAQDAVQDVFAAVLRRQHQGDILAMPAALQTTHLNLMLRSHLNNLWRNARTVKRGGGAELIAWEEGSAEALQLATTSTPATDHDHRWLGRTLDAAMIAMQHEAKASIWLLLNDWLTDCGRVSSEIKRGAHRIALHRAKAQLRTHILRVANVPSFAALLA
jgi:DNA-directed RNA polymerase specialized sigma24 family protein